MRHATPIVLMLVLLCSGCIDQTRTEGGIERVDRGALHAQSPLAGWIGDLMAEMLSRQIRRGGPPVSTSVIVGECLPAPAAGTPAHALFERLDVAHRNTYGRPLDMAGLLPIAIGGTKLMRLAGPPPPSPPGMRLAAAWVQQDGSDISVCVVWDAPAGEDVVRWINDINGQLAPLNGERGWTQRKPNQGAVENTMARALGISVGMLNGKPGGQTAKHPELYFSDKSDQELGPHYFSSHAAMWLNMWGWSYRATYEVIGLVYINGRPRSLEPDRTLIGMTVSVSIQANVVAGSPVVMPDVKPTPVQRMEL